MVSLFFKCSPQTLLKSTYLTNVMYYTASHLDQSLLQELFPTWTKPTVGTSKGDWHHSVVFHLGFFRTWAFTNLPSTMWGCPSFLRFFSTISTDSYMEKIGPLKIDGYCPMVMQGWRPCEEILLSGRWCYSYIGDLDKNMRSWFIHLLRWWAVLFYDYVLKLPFLFFQGGMGNGAAWQVFFW